MKNPLRWDNLSWPQIKAASERGAVVIIPVGSVEQHGPHLPVGCDHILATALADRTAAEMHSRGTPVLVAPAIMVANSVHHMSFAGTITLQPQTFMQMLLEQCRCIAKHGFKKIVLMNGHGGNKAPIDAALVNINSELGFPVFTMGYWQAGGDIQARVLTSQKGMIHACEGETSLMLAVDETLVEPIYKETSGKFAAPTAQERAHNVSTFRRMEETTENGVMGNSYEATKEKGEAIIEVMVKGAADALCDSSLWG